MCLRRGDQYWADYFLSKAFLFDHQKVEKMDGFEEMWCKHALALSQTYLQASHFCQAEYCLLLANCVLPPQAPNKPLHMAAIKA